MLSGQPNTEKGNRAEENQVSSTSSSCFKITSFSVVLNFFAAFCRASSWDLAETHLSSSACNKKYRIEITKPCAGTLSFLLYLVSREEGINEDEDDWKQDKAAERKVKRKIERDLNL